MLTEEVKQAAGNESVTETPAPPGPASTSPQENKNAASKTAKTVDATPEPQKLTYVLNELYFDYLKIKARMKDKLASLVRENLDAFAGPRTRWATIISSCTKS